MRGLMLCSYACRSLLEFARHAQPPPSPCPAGARRGEPQLCGVAPGRVLPISEQWHPLLIKALSSIPALNAGDSVWWHCDVIHSVAPVENQQGWGNVMYIPAAPMCEKNLAYAQKVKIALEKGASPGDFPREDYEASWQGRFTLEDLNIHGKRALGIPV